MAPREQIFGVVWPDLNDGLTYSDLVESSKTASTLVEFYSTKHKNSAPLQGWLQRIRNGQVRCSNICEFSYARFGTLQRDVNLFSLQITVGGGVVTDPNTILRAGLELVYHRLPWKEPDAPYLLEVLFEDDDIVALNKPSGLQVLPGGIFQQRTVLTQLQWRESKQSSSSLARKEQHPVPVHRLGRGTSVVADWVLGILLCAKTKVAKARLAAFFADGTSVVGDNRNTIAELGTIRKISKIYRALVNGILGKDEVVIKQPIGMIRYPGVAKGLYVASSSGKPALSKVNVLERDVQGNRTLVQVEIQSGRPHQIRIHLSFIGHPLLGDPLYVNGGHPKSFDSESIDDTFAQDGFSVGEGRSAGQAKRKDAVLTSGDSWPLLINYIIAVIRGYERPMKPVPGDSGYYLHAHRLFLSHPTTDEVIEITAPLPSILQTQGEANQINLGIGNIVK
ncbi:hypothetical protein HHK36_011139 [Tetracentron sinense]|uniref:Pseudouridine synthase RsuA/RluA-like domain-containing protein n=1 Tax=Tetracentron sinense TaxID=13715 RepID=A0A834ZCA2_TETSI|nr:hypothetical protein HHK36_011139 [Tetracentron sinense]